MKNRKSIEPSSIAVLEAANEAGGINILHICGLKASNEVELFKDYPALSSLTGQLHHEGLSLRRTKLAIVPFWVALSTARKVCSLPRGTSY